MTKLTAYEQQSGCDGNTYRQIVERTSSVVLDSKRTKRYRQQVVERIVDQIAAVSICCIIVRIVRRC